MERCWRERYLALSDMAGIGKAVARRAKAFDMRVIYHSNTAFGGTKSFGRLTIF